MRKPMPGVNQLAYIEIRKTLHRSLDMGALDHTCSAVRPRKWGR